MAVYNAVTQAGFDIVAAHSVKAEMSVASPKSATKNPINIDAILVCKKEDTSSKVGNLQSEFIKRFEKYVLRFEAIGRKLSTNVRFVIACSQALSIASIMRMDSSEARKFIDWAATHVLPETINTDTTLIV